MLLYTLDLVLTEVRKCSHGHDLTGGLPKMNKKPFYSWVQWRISLLPCKVVHRLDCVLEKLCDKLYYKHFN